MEKSHLKMDNEEIYVNTLKEVYYPNLEYLFENILKYKKNKSYNLTACGYFSDIINSLINSEKDKMLTYIYQNQKFLKFLIYHSQMKSLRKVLKKSLNIKNVEDNTNLECKFLKHRLLLYKKIFNLIIDQNKDFPKLCSILKQLYKTTVPILDRSYFIENIL